MRGANSDFDVDSRLLEPPSGFRCERLIGPNGRGRNHESESGAQQIREVFHRNPPSESGDYGLETDRVGTAFRKA